MTANYHTHTKRCMHAVGDDREYVEEAIKGGIKVLGFSDHCPWIFDNGYVSEIRMSPNLLDDYFTSMDKLKSEYKNDIKIYVGFESEYIPELLEKQDALLRDYPVDYQILGEHFIKSEPYALYMGAPSNNETVLANYVDICIEAMETGRYKYLAHPDLMNFRGDPDIYKKHYSRLCKYLKEKNIPIEINILGLCEKRHYPSQAFLSIAKEIGNTAILGCDAHDPKELSDPQNHEIGKKLADSFGLQIIEFLPDLQ